MKQKNNSTTLDGSLQSYLGEISVYSRSGSQVFRGTKTRSYHDANNLIQVYNRLRTSNLSAFASAVQKHFSPYWEAQTPGRYYFHNFLSANASARP